MQKFPEGITGNLIVVTFGKTNEKMFPLFILFFS